MRKETQMAELKYAEEDLPVADLIVDPKVQRAVLDFRKVDEIVEHYNVQALGRVTISLRDNGDRVILDGWHRWAAVRKMTDNAGTIPCRVFRGLTFDQEAQLFLDLNRTNQPKVHDAWRIRVNKGEPLAVAVTGILTQFGWTIATQAGDGKFNAIAVAERVENLSRQMEAEPGLVHAAILVITRAWGTNRHGVKGPMFEGIARFIAEHGKNGAFNIQTLIEKLRDYKDGPLAMSLKARQLAHLRNMKPSMAVADIITELYNEGGGKKKLPAWRHRR